MVPPPRHVGPRGENVPETREQFVRSTRTGPDEDKWRVPCGEKLPSESAASWHYLVCDSCDEAHKARQFRAG